MKFTNIALGVLLTCGYAATGWAQKPTIQVRLKSNDSTTSSATFKTVSNANATNNATANTKVTSNYFAQGCDGNGCGANTVIGTGCADPNNSLGNMLGNGCDGSGYGNGIGSGSGCDGSWNDPCAGMGCESACPLGEPWRLFATDSCSGWNVGGWSNIGYHSANNAGLGLFAPLGAATFTPSPANFNNYADRIQLQQQWFYAEKVADGSSGPGWGGRIDYLYGTDAPDTQAFGIANRHWDNSWDNGGAYGHAIPQLYSELAFNRMSVKIGKFFTIIGNEVVQATGNFFYSRQFTFYNAEPFTHTGILSTYKVNDETTVWNGYAMGWDSGFEDNGDIFLGGFKRQVSTGQSLIYTTSLGRFNDDFLGRGFAERGTLHSVIFSSPVTSRITHLLQTDFMFTNAANGTGIRNTFGMINYLFYKINDRLAFGTRTEWFNFSTEFGPTPIRNANLYNKTVGFNYRITPNLMIRPELRWVWDKERLGVNEISSNTGLPMASQATFGTDLILTY